MHPMESRRARQLACKPLHTLLRSLVFLLAAVWVGVSMFACWPQDSLLLDRLKQILRATRTLA